MLSGMPRRWRGSLSSYPATACNAAATSATVRAIGPTWSTLGSEAKPTAKCDTRPNVGFNPITPQ
jgi:hypothetical protein